MMKAKIEIGLSVIVILIAVSFFVRMAVDLGLPFSPGEMAIPGIVLAFISACSVNLVRLTMNDEKLNWVSVAINTLTFCYALSLAIQDAHPGKIITTLMMGSITLLALLSLFERKA